MLLSALNLKEDLEQVLTLPEASRWKIELAADLEVYITLHSAQAPQDLFQARLLWTDYPQNPPSLKFRDINTSAYTPEAWPPNVPGFRPGTQDACLNICSEGFALHPEWRDDPRYKWSPQGNVLLYVIRELQRMLDTHYTARAA